MPKKPIPEFEGYGFKDLIKSLIYGRKELSPSIKKFLEKHGNEEISSIEVNRQPVRSVITETLNFLSGSQFKNNMKDLNYDKLFHLRLNIRTKNGTFFSLEKNEVIALKPNPKNTPESQSMQVQSIPPHLTTIKMIETAQQKVGADNLFIYSAQHRNCQHFVTDLLKASGIGDSKLYDFIKQDAERLFKDTGSLRRISNTLTDIASRVDVLKEGGELKNQSIEDLKKLPMINRRQLAILKGQPSNGMFTSDMVRNPFYAGEDLQLGSQLGTQLGSGVKRSNKWIDFVKSCAVKMNMSYRDALKSAKVKELYQKSK